MDAVEKLYEKDQLKSISDYDLAKLFLDYHGIQDNKIKVWGQVVKKVFPSGKIISSLYNAKLINSDRELEYPVENISRNISDGIFIQIDYANALAENEDAYWIECELELANKIEREKFDNPMLLRVRKGSALKLIELPDQRDDQIIYSGEHSYISDLIYKEHLRKISTDIKQEENKYQKYKDELNKKIESSEVSLKTIVKKLSNAQNSHEELSEINHSLKIKKDNIEQEINDLLGVYEKAELEMKNKIEKLKSYIREKAVFLKELELIDEDFFDEYLLGKDEKRDKSDMVVFSEEMNGRYQDAVSHIHAFLVNKDILYPRHIIENYLTLIRTNDLIILAGDSGSGKTNLVNSFAEAIGGVAKIIPVKPNWTSSEDLLGYYNPLEKKYLATPFLEAIIEAQKNPETPYFICLDEMNLARVEYYFADFLSKLEQRETQPEINLYSDDESSHILSELKTVVNIITDAKSKYSKNGVVDFVKLIQDEDLNKELKSAFGFGDKDSLIKYHGDIRRMLSGIISTPSKIIIPNNVRIIGTVNIDETTHYLSPKILDRAHIMKFKSPLLTNWDDIYDEIYSYDLSDVSKPLYLTIEEMGIRRPYPRFNKNDEFCDFFVELNKIYFDKLGIDFGMRSIRQGLLYKQLFFEVNNDFELVINNYILHKILPKFTFDGHKSCNNGTKLDLMDKVLLPKLEEIFSNSESISNNFSSVAELKAIIENANSNDGVVNYWS